jgi:hypothetical protein
VSRLSPDPERARLAECDAGQSDWRRWGPYLSERSWGTVREDYSPSGDAWGYFPHEHARSRVYRWGEDGLAGICDTDQNLCLAFAFWNGRDHILKERAFGLTNSQGNHGEDVKEHWWYVDSTPTHSWMRWRYHYPQRAFPYDDLVATSATRGRHEPEYELADTGVLDAGWWDVEIDFAKAAVDDICIRVTVRNCGPQRAALHMLPHLWFRNTWQFARVRRRPDLIRGGPGVLRAEPSRIPAMTLTGSPDAVPLLCSNETNMARVWAAAGGPPFPKDGINDHVVARADTVNAALVGSKAALWHVVELDPGAGTEIRLRLARSDRSGALDAEWESVLTDRQADSELFWAPLLPADPDRARVARQAWSGLLWSKQFYAYDVDRWLAGDPGNPSPPATRLVGRNHSWWHFDAHDVLLMPDKWEYPWFAAWDSAFQTVAVAHVDPRLAKEQLLLLCREWYMHPNGQLPAYEWNFSDVNPPVHAWAAKRVFWTDGGTDFAFLERIFAKLLINFTWWINRQDAAGNNVFSGGFLGLDNIGPFDRSTLPVAGTLHQSDATGWMARYCLDMLEIALTLARRNPGYTDVATKFFEHFAYIGTALIERGLWDETDGFCYDVLETPDGERVPLRYRSMVGLLPIIGVLHISAEALEALPDFTTRMNWFCENRPRFTLGVTADGRGGQILAAVSPTRLRRLLTRVLDQAEFLSPHGIRALSAAHRDQPFTITVGGVTATVDYEPGESQNALFGGNSNWRGPVWLPANYLLLSALRRFADCLGPEFTVPSAGGEITLDAAAEQIAERLIGLYLPGPDGRLPAAGSAAWPEGLLWFHEYFHGDTGAGLGASHQTGWTALLANLVVGDW